MSKVIILGKGGSGKDFLRKRLERGGFIFGVPFTTRPMRDGEKDGVDYHFVSEEKFKKMINENKFLEWDTYKGWYYGTTNETWENSDLFIMTPKSYKKLNEKDKKYTLVIYINIDQQIRRERLLKRNDADDAERRINSDEKDFYGVENIADIIIDNPDF